MRPDEAPIVVEQTFATSTETVWNAITQLDQMLQWYFNNIPAFEARVGFETEFVVECEGRIFPHQWKVTAVEPGKKIQYDWKYRGYPGDAYVVFELTEERDSTKLTLSCHCREAFPGDIPEFQRESCQGGWEYFIQQNLKRYLDNNS